MATPTRQSTAQAVRPPWRPGSWRDYPALQQPVYGQPAAVDAVLRELETKPPLVARGEVARLRAALAEAARGERFVLHGGDCAEMFAGCTGPALMAKLKVLLRMSLVLTYATRKPVLRIGRVGGQYAKPRSQDTETQDNQTLPSYRGDLVNGLPFTPASREPDPQRMRDGYHHAAASLNYVRALIEGGFADLHHPERWNLGFLEKSPHAREYRQAADAITDAIAFMETVGGAKASEELRRIDFYTSHEALLLPFEQALTRIEEDGKPYNLGAHYLWVGYRTASEESAHLEYIRGIRNPVGIKVGPGSEPAALLAMLDLVDPHCDPGRVTLITRFGAAGARDGLRRLIGPVRDSGHPVLWTCDPMHGNTETTPSGRKTRRLEAIFEELEATFETHQREGSMLGGVHFELTGDAVTECTGGAGGLDHAGLDQRYETACDPRLNPEQALELAFLIAHHLREQR